MSTPLVPVDLVNVNGEKKAESEPAAEWHKGFSVVGREPGARAYAKAQAEKAVADWAAMGQEKRELAIKDGRREPKPWDEDRWRLRSPRPKQLRTSPFATPQGAEDFAALARRSGYEDVEVIELAKRAGEA